MKVHSKKGNIMKSNTMIVWKLGSEEKPASDDDIKNFQKFLNKKSNKKFIKKLKAHNVVTHHAVTIDIINVAKGK